MSLLVQPRANFHASIMPTCLHDAFRHTRHTSRFMETTKDLMLISLLHELLPVSRLHSEVFISGFSKTKKKVYKCPKSIKKYQSSSKFNNCQSSALEQSASISNRSDRSKLQSGGTVRSQPRIGSRVASIRHVRRIPWNPLLEPRVGCIRVAPGREERKAKESESDSKKIFKRIFRWEKNIFDIICTW